MTAAAAYVDVRCARCGTLTRLFDLNGAVADPAAYFGGCCLARVRMLEPVRDPVPYDPATAPWPDGYGEPEERACR